MVIGLGNPGRRYMDTRHNAGIMTADVISKSSQIVEGSKWNEGRLALLENGGTRFLLMVPGTYMNASGPAVARVARHYGLGPDRLVVLHDDIDIPLGDVRVKRGGGTGGHRGLVSLEEELGSSGFDRVRIGVSRPPAGVDPADYVLSDFTGEERETAMESISRAAEATLRLVREVAGEEG